MLLRPWRGETSRNANFMKNHKNLFEEVYSFENLHRAYLAARKCKRYKQDILNFSFNLEGNLLKLKQELASQTYRHGGYRQFILCDSKKRQIKMAPFRDRVVHHALCNVIEPIFDQGFIFDSYACRKNKGTHRAVRRLQSFLRTVERESERRRRSRRSLFLSATSQDILKI